MKLKTRTKVGAALVAVSAAAVTGLLVSSPSSTAGERALARPAALVTGSVVLTDQSWTCSGPVDLDLVKVTENAVTGAKDGINLGKNCTGSIAHIEADMWTGDGVKVQNAAPVAHDLTIGGGYVICHGKSPVLHQDGIQVMGGSNITFSGVTVNCTGPSLVDSDVFVNMGGSMDSTPTDIVCDGCLLVGPAAHTFNLGTSLRSGARNSVLCPDRTPFNGAFDETGGGVDVVNENNVQPPATDVRCVP